jgi:hypothetical protein
MPFETARHETLAAVPWDAGRAREAIGAMVADIERHVHPERFWARHPLDAMDDEPDWYKSLYLGAAGMLWALHYLQREGAVQLTIDPGGMIGRVHAAYLESPDTRPAAPSYYLGEVGILLILWRLTGEQAAVDRLDELIRGNIPNPTNEALWAAPGTMVGAWHLHGWTGEERWRDLFLENVEQLWKTWLPSPHVDGHLWTQDLYGSVVQLLGAGHGFAGNVYPLLRAAQWLPVETRETLYARCVETLLATAIREDDCANWPPGVGPPRPGRSAVLVQWCHGAPGIITATADFPAGRSREMDALLLQAGATTWKAGPLAKGYGLCHGTAGNGYAFLKLHGRTGDPLWLERARAFAMHALGQREAMRREHGVGRYSLWTGDGGLAVYLWHCLQGADGMPGLDLL